MTTASQLAFKFDLSGGYLALDFANSISRRDDPARSKEHLNSFDDVISFAAQSNVVSAEEAGSLSRFARRNKPIAERTFADALALREAIFRVFSAQVKGNPPSSKDLKSLNDAAIEALQHRDLVRVGDAYEWKWNLDKQNPLRRVVWEVANSAAELLTSDRLRSLRLCEAPDCYWLFLDQSRNRSRRWCDMTSCGNRQKARRHYQRIRK